MVPVEALVAWAIASAMFSGMLCLLWGFKIANHNWVKAANATQAHEHDGKWYHVAAMGGIFKLVADPSLRSRLDNFMELED